MTADQPEAGAPSASSHAVEGGGGTIMADEIREQPAVLAALVGRRVDLVAALTEAIPPNLRGLVLVARGSSDNAAVYGRYVLEYATRRPVAMAAPSLHTRYNVTTELEGFLVVAVSQSGRTPEIVATSARLAAGGARTVAITNDLSSPLADGSDATIFLDAGEEVAVPATKTFTAQVAAFAILAEALGDVGWTTSNWDVALTSVAEVVDDDLPPRVAVDSIGSPSRLVQIGRGFLYAVALEAGLKIAETSGVSATGYSPPDLQHGPIAVAGPDLHAICYAAAGPNLPDIAEVAEQLADRGAAITVVAVDAAHVPAAATFVPVPAGVIEPLAPLVHTVRAQQLALHLALKRGINPDRPPGLQKITLTD